MSRVAELVAQLRAEAIPVDYGAFTLDAEEARRRLRDSRYLDRDAYLLPVVEGLLACGARQLSIESDAADVIVFADGLRIGEPASRLAEVFAAAFGSQSDAVAFGFGRLAIGIDMALGHSGIREVVVEIRTGTATYFASYAEAQAPELGQTDGKMPAVRVLLDRGLLDDVKALAGRRAWPEFEAVRDAVRYCDRPVFIDGVPCPTLTPNLLHRAVLEGEGFSMISGIDPGAVRSRVIFLSHGVQAGEFGLDTPDALPGFLAVVSLPRAERDLSQANILRNETVERALEAARAAHVALGPPPPPPDPHVDDSPFWASRTSQSNPGAGMLSIAIGGLAAAPAIKAALAPVTFESILTLGVAAPASVLFSAIGLAAMLPARSGDDVAPRRVGCGTMIAAVGIAVALGYAVLAVFGR